MTKPIYCKCPTHVTHQLKFILLTLPLRDLPPDLLTLMTFSFIASSYMMSTAVQTLLLVLIHLTNSEVCLPDQDNPACRCVNSDGKLIDLSSIGKKTSGPRLVRDIIILAVCFLILLVDIKQFLKGCTWHSSAACRYWPHFKITSYQQY